MTSTCPTTIQDLYASFEQFLTCLTCTIIQVRRVYPDNVFERVRAYGVAVWKPRHPELEQYVATMSHNAMELVRQNAVSKVSIVILDEETKQPVERFALDMRNFPVVDPSNLTQHITNALSWGQIHDQYRACLLTLITNAPTFGPLPDTTFTLLCETKDLAMEATAPWVVADAAQLHIQSSYHSTFEDASTLVMTPIRHVDAGHLSFNLYLEQDRVQQKRQFTV